MTLSNLPVSYCTNVHPGRTVAEIVAGLTEHTAVANQLLDRSIAAGLWFSATAVEELSKDKQSLELLAQTLWQHDLSCYTLNTFPFGDFHSERVKENVYLPDWTTAERTTYTKTCARLLAQLMLPEGEGSLSTVPLGGAMNPSGPEFHSQCIANLLEMARYLAQLREETGRTIRLAIEPEPHCHLSSTERTTLPFFEMFYREAQQQGCEDQARMFVGLCFDICHQAVEFEDVQQSVRAIRDADIRINKVHISSAVELTSPASNAEGRLALQSFVEPRYLHQTFAKLSDGEILSRTDLLQDDIAREPADKFMLADAWRVHFHVPIDQSTLGPLTTTRSEIPRTLQAVYELPYAPHLEVETYTWPVMPGVTDQALATRIAGELATAMKMIDDARQS